MRHPSFTIGLIAALPAAGAQAQSSWLDPVGDAVIRETANGGPTTFNANALPDIVSLSIVPWAPTDPATDLYTGQEVPAAGADFFRLDLVFQGLFNPAGLLVPFLPDGLGPRPVFTVVEIDLDNNPDSGGELEPLARDRLLGNVGRFGALPRGVLGARAATSRADYDNVFGFGREFERSGIDMALVLCGCAPIDNVVEEGNLNGIMEAGETMTLTGPFLERFRALEPYSGVFGTFSGAYAPVVDVRHRHDIKTDQTTITLVYPLTHAGSAAMRGEPVEPLDFNVSNQNSILEMLTTTISDASGCCANIGNDPAAVTLSQPWQFLNWQDPAALVARASQHLDPTQWRATVIAGTAYTTIPFLDPYVWTDIGGDVRFADFDHDGVLTANDEIQFNAELAAADGDPARDADLTANGIVVIPTPNLDFELADLNGDGFVDAADSAVLSATRADLNGDGRVSGSDITFILAAFGPCTLCPADLNNDGVVNGSDITNILSNWSP
ncbi:MAG: hypothetical protein D6693_08180 [Planctomycetota bacterium]|nr:MAG: hypothetical protein D6693_08180 [Planctomycetota bacterium]